MPTEPVDIDKLIGKLFYSHIEDDEWNNIPECKISNKEINKCFSNSWHKRNGVVMSRKRVIDTGIYFDTEICSILGDRGLHLYIRLWGIADDTGVYLPNYADIALQMGALKFTDQEVEIHITALVKAEKIIPFESNGKTYHWLKNLLKHQPLNNPSVPRNPLPEWITMEIRKYGSGKKFAKFSILQDKLPVAYHDSTGNVPLLTSRLPENPDEVDYHLPTGRLPVEEKSVETETKRNRNETETKRKETKEICAQFELFWEAYPARNGKKLEKTETQRRFNKLKPDDRKLCITAAHNFAASKGVKEGFGIKDPKRFIRDGKESEPWRDWVEPEKTSGGGNEKRFNGRGTSQSARSTQGKTTGDKTATGKYAGIGEEIGGK